MLPIVQRLRDCIRYERTTGLPRWIDAEDVFIESLRTILQLQKELDELKVKTLIKNSVQRKILPSQNEKTLAQ